MLTLLEVYVWVACLVVGLTAYCLCLYLSQCYKLRRFRGPFAVPIVGNCYHSEALFLMKYWTKLRKVYGKVFTYFAMTKPYIIVCDAACVRRILSDTKTFPKGDDYTNRFGYAFGQGLVTSNAEKHKRDRSVFGKYFIRSNIAKFTGGMKNITDKAIDELLVSQEGKPVNIEKFFARLALRTFMLFSVGSEVKDPKQEELICSSVSKGSHALGRLITIPLPLWRIIPWVETVWNARVIVEKLLQPIVEERKGLLASGKGEDLDDCLTAMMNDKMSQKDMVDHFVTLICAGHDTTAYFSSYLCYLLSVYPDVQEKVVSEIKTTLGNKTELTADDVVEMKYMMKVMQETMRLYSIIPMVTRYSTEEVYIKESDITIPKNTNIIIPMFLINRDPELWVNPSKFDPDRFDNDAKFTSAKNGFFPFGYGTRTCIGNTLAQVESCIFICQLLLKYRIDADPGFKPSIFAGISLTTSNGLSVILNPRE